MPLAEFPAAMQALAGDIDNYDTILGLLEVWARPKPEGYARFLVEHGTGLVMAKWRHSLDLTRPFKSRHLIKENPQAAVDLIDRLAGIGEGNLWSLVASLRLGCCRRRVPVACPPPSRPDCPSRIQARDGGAGSQPAPRCAPVHPPVEARSALTNLLRDGLAHSLERSDANVTQAGTPLAQLPAPSQASVIDEFCRGHQHEVKPERLRRVAAAMGVPGKPAKIASR